MLMIANVGDSGLFYNKINLRVWLFDSIDRIYGGSWLDLEFKDILF